MNTKFTKQDDTKQISDVNIDDETLKYNKIDTLDEDDPIDSAEGKLYALISFISPEGLMNCKIRGIKIRGFFHASNEEEFKERSLKLTNKLRKKDKYFDIFVQEVGKWCPWDPDPYDSKAVKNVEIDDEKLNEIMKKTQKHNMMELNEIVGRHKEGIDKNDKTFKQRIASTIKDNSGSGSGSGSGYSDPHGKEKVEEFRDHLRKKLENSKERHDSDEKTQLQENINKMKELFEKYQDDKEHNK